MLRDECFSVIIRPRQGGLGHRKDWTGSDDTLAELRIIYKKFFNANCLNVSWCIFPEVFARRRKCNRHLADLRIQHTKFNHAADLLSGYLVVD